MDEHASNEAVLRHLHLNSEGSDSSSNDENPSALTCSNESNLARTKNGCENQTSNKNKMECEAIELPCHLPLSSSRSTERKNEMVTDMIKRLSHSSAHFKHQQRNEPDLTPQEKSKIAHSLFEKSPAMFLSRFKKHLTCDDVACFDEYIGDYEIDFHLKEIQRISSDSYKRNKVKNRRYKALMQMMSLGDEYFTEEAMKARDPLLYEEMIGKYLTKEERCAKAAEIMARNEFALSDFLMKHIAQIQENKLYYSLKDKEEECHEEMDSDTEEEIELDDDHPNITKIEKKNFQVEFLQIMQERFLDGKDIDYDYSSIDNNDNYDDLDEEDKDEEEKYFDDEEPEFIHNTNIT